ncbi:MAG TPA: deoxynucleoside kinase [Bacteroidia bacterium]|nr:deoxynucleoside kinase [Bacteroidia bacterium]
MLHKFIAIEGAIGAGKTTLAKMLAADLQTTLLLEEFAENPYLPAFYKDQEKHAFSLELSLLLERHQQLTGLASIQSLVESPCVSDYYFVKSLLFANINLPEDHYFLFKKLFELVTDKLAVPDLVVYLQRPVALLKQSIIKRGRIYEQSITPSYLATIQSAYVNYFKTMKNQSVLILNIGEMDFENKKEDYRKISSLINKSYPMGITELNI